MKVLVLEDEIPAYQKLQICLDDFYSEKVEHHWARSNGDARELLHDNTYDFILSDIQLLDGLSFDLFDSVSIDCPIIFCSAHDDYLFRAFNVNGIAYLLKPYTKEDFRKAMEKYQSLFKKGDYHPLDNTTIDLLKSMLEDEQRQYKRRFVIKRLKGIHLLNVIEISIIEASGDFCIATDTKGRKHPISQKISVLAEQLNPKKFFRINRSQIVHIEYIESIENHFKNRLLIQMKGSSEKVMTSSSTTADFRRWIEQ